MKLRSIKQIKNWQNKRVLLRLDLNIKLSDYSDAQPPHWRLLKVLPTINYLAERGARIIIVAHLGRPQGKKVKALSLAPLAEQLSKLTGRHIELCDRKISDCCALSEQLAAGQIVLLENIRFYPGEETNSLLLAKQLSRLADVYVNDAFANIHRASASMLGVTKFLPSYAGFLLQAEVDNLSKIFQTKGLMVIWGGAKIRSKIKLIKKFIRQAEAIFVGGGLANTILVARGHRLGQSLVDSESMALAKKLTSRKIHLPVDLAAANSLDSQQSKVYSLHDLPANFTVGDLGPKTIQQFADKLKQAKLVVWNGPLGYFENKIFQQGSLSLAKKLIKNKAKVIVGGGETSQLMTQAGLVGKFYFVSTGGGAMLAFLQGQKLPALNKLKVKN